jgi:hypothetical protein
MIYKAAPMLHLPFPCEAFMDNAGQTEGEGELQILLDAGL